MSFINLNVTSGENTMRLWSPHLPKVQIIPVKSAKMLFTINEKDLSRVELKKACPIDADTSAY